MIRLDKMLAHSGYGTRKEVKEFIRKGNVIVNGEIILNDDFKVNEKEDEIIIADETIEYEDKVYLMLNKPDGYITATIDDKNPTVLDLIYGYDYCNLFPVGRLDKDTEGLILLTNDGKLAHRLLSPKYHVNKVYFVRYEGKLTDEAIDRIISGIELEDQTKCLPAEIEILKDNEVLLTIQEGKYHQVKRMFERVNCKVIYLKRIQFGDLKLDDKLEIGKFRELTEEEINKLKNKNSK